MGENARLAMEDAQKRSVVERKVARRRGAGDVRSVKLVEEEENPKAARTGSSGMKDNCCHTGVGWARLKDQEAKRNRKYRNTFFGERRKRKVTRMVEAHSK